MDRKGVTVSQAIEGYFIAAQARRLSPHTLKDYDNTFRRFESFIGSDPPLANIGTADIRVFLNSLDGLSAKTLLNYHTGLSALWTWAVKERLVGVHVVREVDPPRPEEREIIPYTRADLQGMLAACDQSQPYVRPGKRRCHNQRPTALRDRAIILLLVDTGLRASELCDLRLADLDLKNHRLRVMGKGRKERALPVSARTAQAIWRYLTTREDAQRPAAFLFTSKTGMPINRINLGHMLKRTGERAAVPNVTVHRFRHTFAITFLRNGGHIFALQRMLGHTTLDMVNRYLAIADADIERAHQDASPVTNWLL
jgi:integrase/recombinase XerD